MKMAFPSYHNSLSLVGRWGLSAGWRTWQKAHTGQRGLYVAGGWPWIIPYDRKAGGGRGVHPGAIRRAVPVPPAKNTAAYFGNFSYYSNHSGTTGSRTSAFVCRVLEVPGTVYVVDAPCLAVVSTASVLHASTTQHHQVRTSRAAPRLCTSYPTPFLFPFLWVPA